MNCFLLELSGWCIALCKKIKILDGMPDLSGQYFSSHEFCCEFTVVFMYTKRLSYFLFPHPASTLFDQNVPPCAHQEFALSGSNGPILWDCAYTPFTSSVLNTFMIPATHPMKNKWEPTYLCYPESPLTPFASGPIAHSFVLDPSQQEAAFSLTTRGSVWTCSSYC